MSGSEDEETQAVADADSCTPIELEKSFRVSYNLSSEEAVSLQKSYILHLDGTKDFSRIACDTSNQTIHIFDLSTAKGYSQISRLDLSALNKSERTSICGVKFANLNQNVLYVGTVDGEISVLDLRSPNKVSQSIRFSGEKPVTCFDLNSNDTTICAGTEQSQGEAHLLLYDLRTNSLLATYADSHKDDVTQVKFHPSHSNSLASGSTDGLINAFDISETAEDDALEYCLNTESSVQTINWHPTAKTDHNLLSCITHTNDFQLFDVEESEVKYQCSREDVCGFIRRTSADETYLVNAHSASDGSIVLLAGSNSNGGEVLRSLAYTHDTLEPRSRFENNKQIVRCSLFNSNNDTLVTAGEGGIVTVWDKHSNVSIKAKSDGSKLKETPKHKDRKVKPY